MGSTEDFWDDLLAHVRQQVLLPVVGPGLTIADFDGEPKNLMTLVGERLASRYGLTPPASPPTMDEVVSALLRQRGRDESERLYRVINDILTELDVKPGKPLRDLAAIEDLRLFVSTTPDRLLAQAIDGARFHGALRTRQVPFSPVQSTAEQARHSRPALPTEVVVLSLFGQAASTPQYAVHE